MTQNARQAGRLCIQWVKSLKYADGLSLQQARLADVAARRDEIAHLVLVEHTPVITLGRSSRAEHLLLTPAQLAARGVEVHESNRGGDVTFHGPGQLVAYPVMALDRIGRDLHRYLRALEQWLIDLCGRWRLSGERRPGMTGVWIGQRKIAAIGIACRQWIVYHGVALNVCTDLSWFDMIVPCGIREYGVTSLSAELGRTVALAEVLAPAVETFVAQFGMRDWEIDWK